MFEPQNNLTLKRFVLYLCHRELVEYELNMTIDFTVDYLRPGLPKDAYARAKIKRAGRRYASLYVEAWQDNKKKLYAQASGHFLMPLIHE